MIRDKQKLMDLFRTLNQLEDSIVGHGVLPEGIMFDQSAKGIKCIADTRDLIEKLVTAEKERQRVITG